MKMIRVIKSSKKITANVRFENSDLLKYIGEKVEEEYSAGVSPDWELKVYTEDGEIGDLNLSISARNYIRQTCSYPIKDGYMSFMDLEVGPVSEFKDTFDEKDLEVLHMEDDDTLYVDYELELGEEEKEQLEEGL